MYSKKHPKPALPGEENQAAQTAPVKTVLSHALPPVDTLGDLRAVSRGTENSPDPRTYVALMQEPLAPNDVPLDLAAVDKTPNLRICGPLADVVEPGVSDEAALLMIFEHEFQDEAADATEAVDAEDVATKRYFAKYPWAQYVQRNEGWLEDRVDELWPLSSLM